MLRRLWRQTIDQKITESLRTDALGILAILLGFYWSWLALSGVDYLNASILCLILLYHVFVGLPIAFLIFNQRISVVGIFGLSIALGAIPITIVDQFSVQLHIHPLIAQLILSLSLAKSFKSALSHMAQSQCTDYRLLLLIPASVMTGIGVFNQGWMVSILILLLFFGLTFHPNVSVLKNKVCAVCLVGLTLWMIALIVSRTTIQPYGDFLFRPLYTGSDDQLFSESLSWSLAHFGSGEYAPAVGTSIRYHWFSLAWSGFIQKIGGIPPLVTTLHVIPAVSFSVIAILCFELVNLNTRLKRSGFFALFVLFGTATTFSPERFVHVVNTSNVASFMWISVLLLALSALATGNLKYPALVVPGMLGVVLLSKAPFGASAVFGAVITLFYIYLRDRRGRSLGLILLSLLAFALTYLVFLSPHDWEQRKFDIDWNLGGIDSESFLFPFSAVVFVILFFVQTAIGFFPLIGKELDKRQRSIVCFLLSTSFVGLLRFILGGGSAELYFYNVAIFSSSIAAGISSQFFLKEIQPKLVKLYVLVGMLSFALMSVELRTSFIQNLVPVSSFQYIAPLSIGGLISLPFIRPTRRRTSQTEVPLWSTAVLLATVAALMATMLYRAQQPPSFQDSSEIAAVSEIEALTWIRKNVPTDAIIATNRTLCRDASTCKIDESRFLISAFAQRRVLLEGPRFVVGGRPYPTWVQDRIEVSLDFVDAPSKLFAKRLTDLGVDWYYVLKSQAKLNFSQQILAEVGTISFENQDVLIIELRSET